jgi:hypothetical protein
MTRLCCLYNNLDPRAETALTKHAVTAGLDVEWVDTSGSQQAYADALEERWTGEEDLILIEQDKEIYYACLPSLMDCDELWCAYTYWIFPVPHTVLALGGFGVTKFSAELQQKVSVAEFRGEEQVNIDRRFCDLLKEKLGIGCCLHGNVVHHHVYVPRPKPVRDFVNAQRAAGVLPPAVYPEPLGPHLLPGSYDL